MQTSQKQKRLAVLLIAAMLFILLAGCSPAATQETETEQMSGQIILLGEAHYNQEIQQKEIEIWSEYYNTYGMRDLFIEFPLYVAEYLNIWMESDNDDILYEIYDAYE